MKILPGYLSVKRTQICRMYILVLKMALNDFLFFHIDSPTSGRVVTLQTGRREVPGSNPVALVDLAVRSFP